MPRASAPDTSSPVLRRTPGSGPRRLGLRVALSLLVLTSVQACAVEDGGGELGTFTFALTGTMPDVKAFKLTVFQGALTTATKTPKFALTCSPYNVSDTENRNAFTLQDMPVGDDYSVLVEYFGDDACADLKVRAYRGGVAVKAGQDAAAAASPYYLQPARVGAFTGMAQANADLQAEAAQRSCSTDQDCVAVHPAATCTAGKNRCNVDSLFPLNGGARRAFPAVVAMSDGTVTIAGGFSVVDPVSAVWTATTSTVERFDPALGRFVMPANAVDNFDSAGRVGLASGAPLGGATFAMVAGTERALVGLYLGKLTTDLQDAKCAGGGAACPASKAAWRVDLPANLSSGTELPGPIGLPVVARVATPQGPRLLVAGGADLPVPKSGSSRRGDVRLCELSGTAASCTESAAKLAAARARAAVGCIEPSADGCKTLLVIGGRVNKTAPMVEQYSAASDAFETLETLGAPDTLHGGRLVQAGSSYYLLGATTAALFLEGKSVQIASAAAPPYRVVVDDGGAKRVIRFEPADLKTFGGTDGGRRVFGAAVSLSSGHAVLAGGILPDGKLGGDALIFDKDGAVGRVNLETARFGAGMAEIGGDGPFGGCAMLAGGAIIAGKDVRAVNHVEMYCPK